MTSQKPMMGGGVHSEFWSADHALNLAKVDTSEDLSHISQLTKHLFLLSPPI